MLWFGFYNTTYHFDNAEMTPELCDDLINFSFNSLQDVFKNRQIWNPDETYNILTFLPPFLMALKRLSLVCYGRHSHILCILTYPMK
jgi:hypothetical protein